ncbi:MAG TPA: polysaccharide biosynthesis tyrosine autokinase [Vicinamibacterales bacterium]
MPTKPLERARAYPPVTHPTPDEKHVMDYVRVVYRRRWIALPVFLIVFIVGAVNALREIPIYQARVQMILQKDAPNAARLDQVFQSESSWYDSEFIQTQFRILQSRTLARRTIDSMNLWTVPKLGNGPDPKPQISFTSYLWRGVYFAIDLVQKPFSEPPPTAVATERPKAQDGETAAQSVRIDEFLGGLGVVPVRNSQIVEIHYTSSDPEFAAQAANAVAKAYIQQTTEFKFSTSKDAADWLSDRLAEQRKAVEASESALQAYKEKNGGVSITDGANNIVVQRLTELNSALTKAKTERINKEAAYNQLKAAQAGGTLDSFPTVLANEYIQKLRTDMADLQRQQAQLADRYGERHAEVIKNRTAIQAADAKLRGELGKIVESVHSEYQAALGEEQSLQSALDAQKSEALSLNRKGIEYSVLQREADSNRQIYESLMQRTKETGITSESRSTNVRIVDPAEVPRGPISPNVSRELEVSFAMGMFFAVAVAFGLEYLDNRIKSPQELKAQLGIPFLGMVPSVGKDKSSGGEPLLSRAVPANFAEAFKSIRTNVLFSSAEDGMRSVVVTSSGPGEGKSIVSANLAVALAQAGQRVLLLDGDMRRPRVHEIFGTEQEPGVSNILTGGAKPSDAIKRCPTVHGLWLLPSGHIPPNPAELLGSHRFREFIGSLEEHFDWVIVDSPPVLVVTDSSIVANHASGVVFVVGSDKTSRQAARAAVEQLDATNARIIGSVLNRVNLARHQYYYSSYYRKEYSKYYVKNAS